MKKFRFLGLVLLSGLMSLVTVGCGGGNKKVDVKSVSIAPIEAEVVAGRSIILEATVNPSDASDKTLTWSTSKSSVATVKEGIVTGVTEGECVITAKSVSNPEAFATCSIKVLPIASEWVISSVSRNKLLLDFEDNKKEKENKEEEFVDRTKNLVVGTDNDFNIRPSLEIYDEDDNKVEDTQWPYDYVVEIYKKNAQGQFEVASDTYYEVTDPSDASIQFKTTAEGNTFKVVITPGKEGGVKYKEDAKFAQEAIVDVVNGYNVVDAIDLSVLDTRSKGPEWDEYLPDTESDYGTPDGSFDPKWYEFKEEYGIQDISADNFVFLNNVALTAKDIPETFIYKTNQEAAAIGSLKDPMFIYRRNAEDTKIYGNYFTLDYSALPLVVRANGKKSTATENRLDSHSALFRLGAGTLNINDLNIVGNGKRAVEDADKKYSGSLMLVKTHDAATNVQINNCLCRKAYMTLMSQRPAEGYAITTQVNKSKLFENYNCFLYNWGSNITVTDSVMKNAGGPVVIADHIQDETGHDPVILNPDGTYTIEGNPANTKFINCDIDSRVIGTEAWFDMMGATAVTPAIKSLSDLLVQKGANPTAEGVVSKTYITDEAGNPVVGQMYQGTTVMSMLAIGKSNAILSVADLPCKGVPQFTFKDENSNLVIDYKMDDFVVVPGQQNPIPFFELYRGVRDAGAPIFITSGGYAVAIPSDPANPFESTWSLYDLVEYAEYNLGIPGTPTELNAASDFFAKADGYIDLVYQGLSICMKLYDIVMPL